MRTKRPMIKETVGALYLAFNVLDTNGEFNNDNYEETIKSEVAKKIGTTENAESTVVRASGGDYVTASQTSNIEHAVEVIAFDPEDTARMRGDVIGKYGVTSGRAAQRPYFAFGKVVKKIGGGVEYVWYPKCQLTENTDDVETSEDSFTEQNDTLTIMAYSYNSEGDKSYRINSEMSNFPKGVTEELFFESVVSKDEDIEKILESLEPNKEEQGPNANEEEQEIEEA